MGILSDIAKNIGNNPTAKDFAFVNTLSASTLPIEDTSYLNKRRFL